MRVRGFLKTMRKEDGKQAVQEQDTKTVIQQPAVKKGYKRKTLVDDFRAIVAPVSYTHLDVYKRQHLLTMINVRNAVPAEMHVRSMRLLKRSVPA